MLYREVKPGPNGYRVLAGRALALAGAALGAGGMTIMDVGPVLLGHGVQVLEGLGDWN